MKRLTTGLAVAATMALSASAWGQAINSSCPVKTGSAAKPNITTSYKGKTIAFC